MEDSINLFESSSISDEYKSVHSSSDECISVGSDPDDLADKRGPGIDWLISEFGDLTLNESSASDERWFDVRCEPVIDILYAKVFTDSDTSFDVFGAITIEDYTGSNIYVVYDRDQHDCPQRIYPSSTKRHNFLQLSGPEEIPSLNEPRLVVDIRDDKLGYVVARGKMSLYKTTQLPFLTLNKFERLEILSLHGDQQGEGGLVLPRVLVELKYVAFTFGVYARVQMFLYKDAAASKSQKMNTDEDNDKKGVEVFGLICAKCNPLILPKECYENHMFNLIEDDHEWVGLGTEIFLSKDLVAVPAYSELEISVDLKGYEDAEFIVQGNACFEPTNYSGGRKEIRGENGFYVLIHVTWCEPSLLNKPWQDGERVGCFLTVQPEIYASHLLEVFSLFIGRPNDEEVSLYGSVKIFDSQGFCDIFTCSKNEAYFLARGCNLLPLQGPKRAITPGMFFYIEIDLSDIDGNVKIKGFVQSSVGIDERQTPWYDRRLCSVVRGAGAGANEKSFVAINYSLFSFAVQAILTVRLVSNFKSSAHVKIYGDITASYDKLSYSTKHDSVFFQSVLFTRNEANSLEVGENLELSRSLVAVPMTFSLMIHVDLSFQTSEGTHYVDNIVKFQIGELYTVIKSGFVDIRIDVEWKGLPYV